MPALVRVGVAFLTFALGQRHVVHLVLVHLAVFGGDGGQNHAVGYFVDEAVAGGSELRLPVPQRVYVLLLIVGQRQLPYYIGIAFEHFYGGIARVHAAGVGVFAYDRFQLAHGQFVEVGQLDGIVPPARRVVHRDGKQHMYLRMVLGFHGHDGHAEHSLQLAVVDRHAAAAQLVHHIERDDDGRAGFEQLQGKVKVARKVVDLTHVYYDVVAVFQHGVAAHALFGTVYGKRIKAGQVANLQPVMFEQYGFGHRLHRHAVPVADVFEGVRDLVVQSGLAHVGVAHQRYFTVHGTAPRLSCRRRSP